MAKSRFLSILTHRGSSKKSASNKKGVASTVLVPNESRVIKSPEELPDLLNSLPEAESESDRELSFTYLVDSLPKNDDGPAKGAKEEQKCDEATTVKEEDKMCRCRVSRNSFGSGRVGVLLNFHVLPVPLKDTRRSSRSVREIPCTTLAEIQKREVEFSRFGSWSALLRRQNKIPVNRH